MNPAPTPDAYATAMAVLQFTIDETAAGPQLAALHRVRHGLGLDADARRRATAPELWADIVAERMRAHAKHGETSCEGLSWDDRGRLAILVEEVGEVAKELNDARHDDNDRFPMNLRTELVQVAAVAVGWIAALDGTALG